MWRQSALRTGRLAGRTKPWATNRSINGQSQIPHTTYFQPPPEPPKPRRRILRSILLGTTLIGVGAFAHSWLLDIPFLGLEMVDESFLDEQRQIEDKLQTMMSGTVVDFLARNPIPMPLDMAKDLLAIRATYAVTSKAISHGCQLPSNAPCEDTMTSGIYNVTGDVATDWSTWSIFDGHAGAATSEIVQRVLPNAVGNYLLNDKCMDRPYMPNDSVIVNAIKTAFKAVDEDFITRTLADGINRMDLARTIANLAPMHAGSCALFALFDPVHSVLRVANVGDSRAVLGRWDASAGQYVAKPMSIDQTGFNPDEVERLRREHPGEEPVDPKTGRVHGIAVSRAFGDFRWKWPQEMSQRFRREFWGPKPRPDGMVLTPPYLTAVPEVMESEIETTTQQPDFLIMASDGLWDLMSSEDAVTCVAQWLEKFKPDAFLLKQTPIKTLAELFLDGAYGEEERRPPPKLVSPEEAHALEDTYVDEEEGIVKWRVSPKHFIVEDENCGVHLIKNALGGKRRNLFCGVMSIQPPLSRDVRDDISVHVIFFGDWQESIADVMEAQQHGT